MSCMYGKTSSSFLYNCSQKHAHTQTHTLPQPLPSSLSHVRFSSLPHTHTHTRPSLSGREEGSRRDGKGKKAPTLATKATSRRIHVCMCAAVALRWSRVLQLSSNGLPMETPRGAKWDNDAPGRISSSTAPTPFGDEVSATRPRRRAETSGHRQLDQIQWRSDRRGNGWNKWRGTDRTWRKYNQLNENRLEGGEKSQPWLF